MLTVIIVAGLISLRYFTADKHQPVVFTTAVVQEGKISNTVTATGTISPITEVEVGTQVSGVIKKLYVDFNSVVKKGQLLAELDKVPLQTQVNSTKSDLMNAENDLDYYQKNFNRTRLLHDKKSVSDADYDNALYQLNKTKANVDKARSELSRVQNNLDYATIYSPIDGVVLLRAVDEGQTVAANFSTPKLFTIANDLTKMQVIANVDEADIGQIRQGQRVSFTVDAFPEDVFSGTVTQVRLEPTVSSNVVTYSVVVEAPNPYLKLKPGLTASITVFTQESDHTLIIPIKALHFTPDSTLLNNYLKINKLETIKPDITSSSTAGLHKGKTDSLKKIWIKEGKNLVKVEVSTGINDGTNIEIRYGLNPGQEVILSMESEISSSGNSQTAARTSTNSSPFLPKHPGKK